MRTPPDQPAHGQNRQRPFPNKANAPGVKKILRRCRFANFQRRTTLWIERSGWLASRLRAVIRASAGMLMTVAASAGGAGQTARA
jgi:hypothetical protein